MNAEPLPSVSETVPNTTLVQSDIQKLNKWLFEIIHPFIKGRILEIDTSIDSISSLLLDANIALHLNGAFENDPHNLYGRNAGRATVKSLQHLELKMPDFSAAYANLSGAFDTIIGLNIQQHGPFDKPSIQKLHWLLQDRGHLMIILPAYTSVYTGLDQDAEDWKKYNQQSVKKLLGSKFELLKIRLFNFNSNIENIPPEQRGLSALVVARSYT